MKLTKGTRIRWTASDAMGRFQQTGTVIKATKDNVVMLSDEVGEMAFENTDGQIEVMKSSKTSIKRIEDREREERQAVSRARRRARGPAKPANPILKAGSVKFQVFELLQGKKGIARKDAIQMIVDAGLSTPAGASTHFNSIKELI